MNRKIASTMMDFHEIESKLMYEERYPFTITNMNIVCSVSWTTFSDGPYCRLDCPSCMAVEERGVGSMIQNYLARNSYEKER